MEVIDWMAQKHVFQKKKRILLIEDCPADALLMQESLAYLGKKCDLAQTAEAAQALLHRNHIGIAFVDLRLTFMPGWELIPLIWQSSPETFVVVTCGEITDVAKIKGDGIFTVLSKPVTIPKLQALFARMKG